MAHTGNSRSGFTLVEAALSLALASVILVVTTTFLKNEKMVWQANSEKAELVQNARMAMVRMINDLRYGKQLYSYAFGPTVYGFEVVTRGLETTAGDECVRYQVDTATSSDLMRQKGTWSGSSCSYSVGTDYPVAGHYGMGYFIKVTQMQITPYDVDASNILFAPVPLSNTKLVQIKITLKDRDNNQVTLESTAKLRNKS